MPEWLQSVPTSPQMELSVLFLRVLLSAAFGVIVAGVFAFTQRRPPGQMLPMVTTLVLLTILVAMTTIVIGDSVARAFGLVGALSIVRFRTVVDDTRDTSFVIFAVVTGMALGAGNLYVCLIAVPIIAAVAYTLGTMGRYVSPPGERKLEIRLSVGRDPETMFHAVFEQHLYSNKLISVVSARQGAAIDLAYRVRLRDSMAMLAFIKAIQALEGVQGVDLKEP